MARLRKYFRRRVRVVRRLWRRPFRLAWQWLGPALAWLVLAFEVYSNLFFQSW